MQELEGFIQRGFSFIDPCQYLAGVEDGSLVHLNRLYETALKSDGPRNRAYFEPNVIRLENYWNFIK